MRLLAIIPIAFCTTSFVLAFLCLFAGNKEGVLEDYAVLTLNTSRLGQNIFETSDNSDSFLGSLIDDAQSEIQDAINSVAKELGLHDWYSAHLMTYCEGFYTRSGSGVKKNTTFCSKRTAMYDFDPQQILQDELDANGRGIDLSDLNWPDTIQDGIDAVRISAKAAFVLYCIAIGFIGLALISAVISLFFSGRMSALVNIVLDWLAFVVLGVASAIATAVAVKASEVINEYGDDIGISARKGRKFLIITWIATGLLLLSSIVWCFDCILGRRHRDRARGPKHG